jgi:hypothetical protein
MNLGQFRSAWIALAVVGSACGSNANQKTPGIKEAALSPRPSTSGGGRANSAVATPACQRACDGTLSQFVISNITLPADNRTYAYDLVGANPPKRTNALGGIVSAFSAGGWNEQESVTKAILAGRSVTLLTAESSDPSFTNDTCGATVLNAGLPTDTPPDFTQVQSYTVDDTIGAGNFTGPIVASNFESGATATTTPPVIAHLSLALFGPDPLALTVYGAHLRWAYQSGNLVGVLNGAIKKSDADTVVIPGLAQSLNSGLAADAANGGLTPRDRQVLQLFDNGGFTPNAACGNSCANPNGTCAAANDGKIDICEVATSPVIQTVFAPDVQLFDAKGDWHPNPNATSAQRDSLSLGVAFDAVPASF